MKRIKVFARKLSLMSMTLILALVMIPSDFVFAEDAQELVWEELRPVYAMRLSGGCQPPPIVLPPDTQYIPPTLTIKKQTDNNETGTFTFRIRLYDNINCDNIVPLSIQEMTEVEDNFYEFSLKNQQSQDFIFYGYSLKYEVYEINNDEWELVSINGEKGIEMIEGEVNENNPEQVIFRNRKILQGEAMAKSNIQNDSLDDELEPAAPNTGENTGDVSAVRTGIIAFSVFSTIIRVIYLVRHYQKNS